MSLCIFLVWRYDWMTASYRDDDHLPFSFWLNRCTSPPITGSVKKQRTYNKGSCRIKLILASVTLVSLCIFLFGRHDWTAPGYISFGMRVLLSLLANGRFPFSIGQKMPRTVFCSPFLLFKIERSCSFLASSLPTLLLGVKNLCFAYRRLFVGCISFSYPHTTSLLLLGLIGLI